MSTVRQFCAECQQERRQFAVYHESRSPGCAALWRLAFTPDDDAWVCVKTIFEPWLTRVCDTALKHAPRISGLSSEDLADVVQDVWHNLWRYVVRNRTAALLLVADDQIGRVIALIKTTAKNRVVELCRKPRGDEGPLPADEPLDSDTRESDKSPLGRVDPPDVEGVLDLLAFLHRHIRTEQEARVAEVIFLQGMKPQDMVDLYPSLFTSVKEVNQVQQNLIRRLRSDPARQNFGGSASLEFRLESNEALMQEKQNLFDPCPFDEDILVNYINGHVDAAVKATIERSPACLEAANTLKADLAAWRPYLREMFCPDNEELVAYQEHRLEGTSALLVHNHVQQCPFCRAEVEMLAAMDAVPLAAPSLVRRLYELIFQPATLSPVPVLGEGSYRTIERTPQIELLVRTTRTAGKQRNWLLMGRLRYDDEQPFTQVESIIIQDIEEQEAPARSATVDEMGTFTIKELDAGLYRIHLLLPGEEIILHEFRIGDSY
jgi:hypothetical protein